MIILNQKKLDDLLLDSTIILAEHNGIKVAKLIDGSFIKFFRLKRWLSSALFCHYADRFVVNYQKLKKLNIATIDVLNIYKVPRGFIKNSKLSKAVQYKPLEGIIIRELIINNSFENKVVDFAVFIAKLHNLGIFFRSAHFANIIYNSDLSDSFGLIDIENIKFYSKPLNFGQRKRNFKHMMRYEVDKKWLFQHKPSFLENYLNHSSFNKDIGLQLF